MEGELAGPPRAQRAPRRRPRVRVPIPGGTDARTAHIPSRAQRGSMSMSALEVSDLSVEAGGTTVVEGLDFALAAGDKVGVVGRNGAGKTSTLRVLAGEEPAAAGTVVRRGAVGYLRQDPRQHRADDGTSALEYVLAARGLVDLSEGSRRLGSQLEERASEDQVARFARLEDEYRTVRRVSRRSRRRGRSSPDSGWPRTVSTSGGGALRRRTPPARARADPVRRLRPAAARRADEPPRRGRQGLADAVPRGLRGRAPRRQPRHRRCSTPRSPASCTSTATGSSSTGGRTRSTAKRGRATRSV